jgi:hypothetical protein
MKQKHENIFSPSLFYCFIDFGKSELASPKAWIVPSITVAKVLKISHSTWLSMPGKNGHLHKDTEMRRFLPDYTKTNLKQYGPGWLDKYFERWSILKEQISQSD